MTNRTKLGTFPKGVSGNKLPSTQHPNGESYD
jgi:hypothetical protein